MDHLDTSWCPVCDRNILPKRITVQVPVQAPAAPQPPVASPPAPVAAAPPVVARTRSQGGRARGLVHGTGRAKGLTPLRRPSPKNESQMISPIAPAPPVVQMKTRTVIDQGPIPLYCSDECRILDMYRLDGVYDYDFDPLRHGVQPNATASVLPQRQGSASSDAASSPTDTDSSSTSDFSHALALSYADMSPSMATLAAHYKFAELPAPTFIRPTTVVEFAPRRLAVDSSVDATVLPERQMKPASQPEQMKKTFMSPSERYTAKLKQRMPIPSQTDGSDVWRQDVYCASPSQDSTLVNSSEATSPSTAYGGSSRRPSVGKSVAGSSSRTASMPPVHRTQPDASALAEIYGPGYTLFDPSREAKRAALFPGPSSLPTRSRSSLVYAKREVPLLPAAAQGKLLVPNIKLKRTTSAASVTSVASAATSRSPRALPRRGSAMSDLIIPEHTVPASFRPPVPPRKSEEDKLYSIVPWTHLVKRTVIQVVNGVEQVVEIEERVPREVPRLFLGPDGVNHKYEARKAAEREAAAAAAAAAKALRREEKAHARAEAALARFLDAAPSSP